MALHPAHDVGRYRARVQSVSATGRDAPQHLGQRRVAQPVADRMGLAIGAVKVGRSLGVKTQPVVVLQQAVQAWADGKTLLGQLDRRLHQRRPGQPALGPVRRLQHAQRARHAHGAAAHHRLHECHRLAVRQQEQPLVHRCGRGLAAVPGLQ